MESHKIQVILHSSLQDSLHLFQLLFLVLMKSMLFDLDLESQQKKLEIA